MKLRVVRLSRIGALAVILSTLAMGLGAQTPPVEASWRCHEQSGHPLPAIEARQPSDQRERTKQKVAAPPPGPDVIVFNNGDRISGKLTEVNDGKAAFHSDVLGDISVSLAQVKTLHTAGRFVLIQKGQKVTPATPAAQVKRGAVTIANHAVALGRNSRAVPLAQAEYLVPQSAYDAEIHGAPGWLANWTQGWSGSLTAGAALVAATQNSRTFTAGAALTRSTPGVDWLAPRYRTTVDFSAAYGSVTAPNTTPNRTNIIHASLERDWYVSPRLFLLAVASFDHNYSQGLKLQQIYGGGAGYTLIKSAVQQLDLKTDLHFERQAFSATPNVVPVTVSPPKNLVGMDFGNTYMRHLIQGMVLNQALTLTPAFNNWSAYSALATASVLFPVHARFSFNLGVQDTYLNEPGFGSRKNSFLFAAGLGYSLK